MKNKIWILLGLCMILATGVVNALLEKNEVRLAETKLNSLRQDSYYGRTIYPDSTIYPTTFLAEKQGSFDYWKSRPIGHNLLPDTMSKVKNVKLNVKPALNSLTNKPITIKSRVASDSPLPPMLDEDYRSLNYLCEQRNNCEPLAYSSMVWEYRQH